MVLTQMSDLSSASLTQPNLATSSQFQPIGLDIGNGALKMYSALGETLMESYIYMPEKPADHPGLGYVEYLQGSRADLAGKCWVGGANAYSWNPTQLYRPVDDPAGKVQLSLQLLLSAIAHMTYRPQWDLYLAPSIHDGPLFGKQLKQALEGSHQIRVMGKPCVVNVRLYKVFQEGQGAAFALRDAHDFSRGLLFDLGNGTNIVSSFAGLQITDREYNPETGVNELIEAIATSDQVRAKFLKPGDLHLIRAGIEKGDFSYGNEPDWNFKAAYAEQLPAWFERCLKPMLKAAASRVPAATATLAVGGGAHLPGVSQMLAKRGITVPSNARWVNAKGLYMAALRGMGNG